MRFNAEFAAYLLSRTDLDILVVPLLQMLCVRFLSAHCTALHCTALHCTALHCTALQFAAAHTLLRFVRFGLRRPHGTARHSTARLSLAGTTSNFGSPHKSALLPCLIASPCSIAANPLCALCRVAKPCFRHSAQRTALPTAAQGKGRRPGQPGFLFQVCMLLTLLLIFSEDVQARKLT
jgi:hypothetical protein